MKQKFKLFPRFHYTFRFVDLVFSFLPFYPRKEDHQFFFNDEDLFFFNSARTGLSVLLKSLSKGKKLRIGIQPYNCETVFQAIVRAGCVPVFIDINANFTIDSADLIKKNDEIDILIVTHTFGIPAEIDELRKIIKEKIIIEDCAHAFMSKQKGNPCGTFGDAAIFSLGYGKFPSIGHGGFVLINNKTIKDNIVPLYEKLPMPNFIEEVKEVLRNYVYSIAFKPILYGLITYPMIKKLDQKYDFVGKRIINETRGYVVNKNVLYHNLKRYLKINFLRKEKSLHLISLISENRFTHNIEGNNFYLLPLLINQRDMLYTLLFNAGYECGKHFSDSISISEKFGYSKGSCPNAEKTAQMILVMPNVWYLNEKEMRAIAVRINTTI